MYIIDFLIIPYPLSFLPLLPSVDSRMSQAYPKTPQSAAKRPLVASAGARTPVGKSPAVTAATRTKLHDAKTVKYTLEKGDHEKGQAALISRPYFFIIT